jgi:SAM-dependent methyltransferase
LKVLSRLFGSADGQAGARASGDASRVVRRSNGLNELTRALSTGQNLRVLDLGPTSPQNISYFTNLGHRIHNEDVLLASRDVSLLTETAEGQKVIDVARFMAENLCYEKEYFDAVLCWDTPDYLSADLVKPIVNRVYSIMKPKGLLLSFFHTRDAGPDAPYHRYHILGDGTLQLQQMASERQPGASKAAASRYANIRLQRVFNNRHIENLFHDYSSIKFFLGRDNIREVLVVR